MNNELFNIDFHYAELLEVTELIWSNNVHFMRKIQGKQLC